MTTEIETEIESVINNNAGKDIMKIGKFIEGHLHEKFQLGEHFFIQFRHYFQYSMF